MKSIQRNNYLQQLINRKENGQVKIITGIRRCGKSYLLFKLYYNYLLSIGVNEKNIITLALDEDKNIKYRKPDNLAEFLNKSISNDNETFYIFLDEVQFAILENNGELNVILKEDNSLLDPLPVIEDGQVNFKTLKRLNMNKEDLYKIIFREGFTKFDDIFLLLLKENGVFLLPYEK